MPTDKQQRELDLARTLSLCGLSPFPAEVERNNEYSSKNHLNNSSTPSIDGKVQEKKKRTTIGTLTLNVSEKEIVTDLYCPFKRASQKRKYFHYKLKEHKN